MSMSSNPENPVRIPCPACGGDGREVTSLPCRRCEGEAFIEVWLDDDECSECSPALFCPKCQIRRERRECPTCGHDQNCYALCNECEVS
jgi:hypothetical protein